MSWTLSAQQRPWYSVFHFPPSVGVILSRTCQNLAFYLDPFDKTILTLRTVTRSLRSHMVDPDASWRSVARHALASRPPTVASMGDELPPLISSPTPCFERMTNRPGKKVRLPWLVFWHHSIPYLM